MSTKWPLTVLVLELSEERRAKRLSLSLEWIPREEYQGAGDLSNLKFSDFAPERRVEVRPAKLEWRLAVIKGSK